MKARNVLVKGRGCLGLAMVAGGAVMVGAPALSQTIAIEQFVYPQGAPLNAVTPGGVGWTGAWNMASPGSWTIDSQGSAYSKGLSRLRTAGNRIHGSSAGSQRTFGSGVVLGNVTETVWVSFIAQQTYGASNANWLGVNFPCTGPNSFLFVGKPWSEAAWGFDAGSIPSHRVGTKSPYQKAFIVARFDLRGGGALDDVTMWVNPKPGATPVNASEVLTLPNYGNFEGMSKAIVEIGSTSGLTTGHLDELRVGRTYADVAPRRPGFLFHGYQHEPVGAAILEDISPDSLLVSNLGGTGNDGVRIEVRSLAGSMVRLDTGELAPGSAVEVSDLNWFGEVMGTDTLQRTAGGDLRLECDYSGRSLPSAVSVRVEVYDGAGNLVHDGSSAGALATVDLGSFMMDPLCPGGGPRYWYRVLEFDNYANGRPGLIRLRWVYGCGEEDLRTISRNSVLLTLTLDACADCETDTGGTNGTEMVLVKGTGLAGFGVAGAATEPGGAVCTGLGDAAVSQSCGGGGLCVDESSPGLVIDGIGETGNDGVDVRFGGPADSVSYTLEGPASLTSGSFGETVFMMDVVTEIGDRRRVGVRARSDGGDRAMLSFDLSEIGVAMIEYTLSQDGVVVATGETPPGSELLSLIPMPSDGLYHPKHTWTWVPWWWVFPNITVWGPLMLSTNSGTVVGNQLEIRFADGEQVVAFEGFSATGTDLSGPLTIAGLTHGDGQPPCPADFNGDGFLDFFDYDAFVGAFEAGTSDADFNADGFIDFFDYDAFVGSFETGC